MTTELDRVDWVDPQKVSVSELNERREYTDDGKLTTSVEEAGIFQFPAVRESDANQMEYEVVVGQRRVQAAMEAGMDEIPVLVFPWDDGEAMYASIAENIDSFRKDAGEKNRAKAVVRLMHLRNWSVKETADKLEVPRRTVSNWCERGREFWQGTPVHIGGDEYVDAGKVYSDIGKENNDDDESAAARGRSDDPMDTVSDEVVTEVRREVEGNDGDPDEAVDVLDTVAENDLTRGDVREARDRVNAGTDETDDDTEESSDATVESDSADLDDDEGTSNGGCSNADDGDEAPDATDREENEDDSDDSNNTTTFTEAIEEVAEENREQESNPIDHKRSVRFTVVDDDAVALDNATETEGLTVKQIGRKAIAEYLEQGEYYE